MPPRKNTVKSGNAGTSSKGQKTDVPSSSSTPNAPTAPPPLFPPGSKTPLALLNERCQKNGWDRPEVQTFRRGETFNGAVTVRKRNPKTLETESVRLEPRPPLEMKTALEAKHWAATYALYRFCNNIQLNRVLPDGPRQYWKQLEDEHRSAPDHLKWQYDPDPFAAKLAVEERQKKAAVKRENPPKPVEDDLALLNRGMEVRMSETVRTRVEAAIKEAIGKFPGVIEEDLSSVFDDEKLAKTLQTYGFKEPSIRKTLDALSTNSSFATSLLSTMTATEAALEYLLLYTPEHDLPKTFTSTTSSTPFVSSLHSGKESMKRRQIEDLAFRQAGYPRHAIKEALNAAEEEDLGMVLEMLLNKLAGQIPDSTPTVTFDEEEERNASREAEIEAVQSVYPNARFDAETSILSIPLEEAPITLNVVYSVEHPYPAGTRLHPFFISSDTEPAYLRLYLSLKVMETVERSEGEPCCFNAIEVVNDAWTQVKSVGCPAPEDVIKNFIQVPALESKPESSQEVPLMKKWQRPFHPTRDPRSDEQVLQDLRDTQKKERYKMMEEQRIALPAWQYKNSIVETVKQNQVVVMVGETGCGKTTQVPQFILDSEIAQNRGASVQIIVTQPRRISVLGVSSRVKEERADDGSVGYSIRGERHRSLTTKILYCTTGILLRRLANGDDLSDVSHVIVDEVHERSVDSDFLLLELKEMVKKKRGPKVVLMSATINQQSFSDYFNGAPVLQIPGRTFPVETLYLEDILSVTQYSPSPRPGGERLSAEELQSFRQYFTNAGTSPEVLQSLEIIRKNGRIDHQLVAATVKHIVSNQYKEKEKGAILIFMPGVQEITECVNVLQRLVKELSTRATVLPLHANLSVEVQRKVFAPMQGRKIIVATNVAETSITIDDVVFVIDCGRVKENNFDSETGLELLQETSVTLAAANQRQGRAGRTQPGKCFRLYTRRDEQNMRRFPSPEMHRVPLESLSLQVKVTRPDEDVKVYLSRALDPPNLDALQHAWCTLQDLGAIDMEDELTALGKHLARIPIDLRLGKILVYGVLFGCLSQALTIAACLTSKPLFFSPADRREEATQAVMRFYTGNSDLLTTMTAVESSEAAENKRGKTSSSFCEENFISPAVLRDIKQLRQDFLNALAETGLVPFGIPMSEETFNQHSGNLNVLKAIIVGGLWPRVVKAVPPKATFDRIAAGTSQRDHQARDVKFFDQKDGRVFLHPSSTLFSQASFKSRLVCFFTKVRTNKIYIRDVTEAPVYAALLLGGEVKVHHISGSMSIGGDWVKLKGSPRIGVLVNQLRRLLNAQLQLAIEKPDADTTFQDDPIVKAMLELITTDGLDRDSL